VILSDIMRALFLALTFWLLASSAAADILPPPWPIPPQPPRPRPEAVYGPPLSASDTATASIMLVMSGVVALLIERLRRDLSQADQ
jgi:hypothetical protein